jgi:hypothetical protein
MKVLHQTYFAKELGRFRRGTFEFPEEFESLLFCVYLLAVNSLHPEVVESMFSTPKAVLVVQFQRNAQLALSKVNFVTTDRILVLQALLHYVVRYLFHHVTASVLPKDRKTVWLHRLSSFI